MEWQPIETALAYIKSQGKPYMSDTPVLLLFADGKVSVAYWDEYYAEGGFGWTENMAWIEPCSGEQLNMHYDGLSHWMPFPTPPVQP